MLTVVVLVAAVAASALVFASRLLPRQSPSDLVLSSSDIPPGYTLVREVEGVWESDGNSNPTTAALLIQYGFVANHVRLFILQGAEPRTKIESFVAVYRDEAGARAAFQFRKSRSSDYEPAEAPKVGDETYAIYLRSPVSSIGNQFIVYFRVGRVTHQVLIEGPGGIDELRDRAVRFARVQLAKQR